MVPRWVEVGNESLSTVLEEHQRISAAHCGQFVMICVCKSMEFGCADVTVFSSVHSRKADAINTLSAVLLSRCTYSAFVLQIC